MSTSGDDQAVRDQHEHAARNLEDRSGARARGRNDATRGAPSEWLPEGGLGRPPQALLLKPLEAARSLSLSPRTLWDLTKRGEIPCIRIRRLVRYDPHDLTAWISKKKDAQR